MWTDFFKDWIFKKEDFKIGVLAGFWIIFILLLLFGNGGLNVTSPFHSKSFDLSAASPDNNLVVQNEFEFIITNISQECLHTEIEFNDGIKREGDYCEGENIYIGNWVYTIKKIGLSKSYKNPVKIHTTKKLNLTFLLSIASILIPFIIIWIKFQAILERREERVNSAKRKELAKELNTTPDAIDKLRDYFEDE